MFSQFRILFFILFLAAPGAGSASTVNLDIRLDFDATKTVHDCFAISGGWSYSNPGPGNCGIYQNVNFNETLPSFMAFSGAWDTDTGRLSLSSVSCYFGSVRCVLAEIPYHSMSSLSSISLWFGGSISSLFSFNLLTGSGQHRWEDDDAPFYSKGVFDLTNVRAVIATEVPLPASVLMLSLGLAALGGLRLRRRL